MKKMVLIWGASHLIIDALARDAIVATHLDNCFDEKPKQKFETFDKVFNKKHKNPFTFKRHRRKV